MARGGLVDVAMKQTNEKTQGPDARIMQGGGPKNQLGVSLTVYPWYL